MPITGAPASWIALGVRPEPLRKLLRLIWRPTNGPAALALVVIVSAGILRRLSEPARLRAGPARRRAGQHQRHPGQARRQYQRQYPAGARPGRDAVHRARYEPAALRRSWPPTCFRRKSQLRSIAGAPDLVVALIYPMAGNEQAHRPRLPHATRRSATRRCGARDTGELVLAGPVDLVQGGRASSAASRSSSTRRDGKPKFWGIVSAVIDRRPALPRQRPARSRPADRHRHHRPRRHGRCGRRASSAAPRCSQNDPVTAERHPALRLLADCRHPQGRLGRASANTWMLRLLIVVAGALIMVPIVMTGRLIEERQRQYPRTAAPRDRAGAPVAPPRPGARQLADRRLGARHSRPTSLLWDDRMNELYGLPGRWRSARIMPTGSAPSIRTTWPAC